MSTRFHSSSGPARLAALALGAAALPALAQAPDIARCRTIVDATARLACYDALPGPAVAAPAVAGAAFGLPRPAAETEQGVASHIAGTFEGWGPGTRVRLANGQVWQVVDGSSAALYLRDPKVRIKHGLLGDYVFEVEGSNLTAKVRRLQ
jgi:hypothetical protein